MNFIGLYRPIYDLVCYYSNRLRLIFEGHKVLHSMEWYKRRRIKKGIKRR